MPMMLTVVPLSKYQNIAKETNAITYSSKFRFKSLLSKMQKIKYDLEMLLPDLKSAITNFDSESQFAQWSMLFVAKVQKICQP
jgi:hypothetical protein